MADREVVRELITLFGFEVDESKLGRITQLVGRIGATAQREARQVDTITRSLQRLGAQYLGLRSIMGLGRAIFGTNAGFQQLEANMTTIEGSAERAQQVMAQLDQFAAATPFTLEQNNQAWINLRTAGIEPTLDLLEDLGDIAAARGRSITDITEAVQSAVVGEMERLRSFGVLARVQGDELAVTFNGSTERIGRDADSILTYLRRISDENFAGGMERQMDTLVGRVSNLRDAWSRFLRRIGETGFNEEMSRLLVILTEMMGTGEGTAEALGRVLGGALRIVADALQWVADNGELVRLILLSVASYAVIAGIQSVITALWAMNFAAMAIPAAIIATILLIGLVIQDLRVWARGGESVFGDLLESLEDSDSWIARVLRGVAELIQGNIGLGEFADQVGGIAGMFLDVANAIAQVVSGWQELQNLEGIGDLFRSQGEQERRWAEEAGVDEVTRDFGDLDGSNRRRDEQARQGISDFVNGGFDVRTFAPTYQPPSGSPVVVRESPVTVNVTSQPGETPEQTGQRTGQAHDSEMRRRRRALNVGG